MAPGLPAHASTGPDGAWGRPSPRPPGAAPSGQALGRPPPPPTGPAPSFFGGGFGGPAHPPLPRLPPSRHPRASFKNSRWAGLSCRGRLWPPSLGCQCQMSTGDKSSIFLVLRAGREAFPQHHLLLAVLPAGAGVAKGPMDNGRQLESRRREACLAGGGGSRSRCSPPSAGPGASAWLPGFGEGSQGLRPPG